jgi:peroxiredoxin
MGIIRSAFVIDPAGKVADAFYKISPKATFPSVLPVLEELRSAAVRRGAK